MEPSTWQSQLLEYVAYNRVFVVNERQEAMAVETKRRSQARSRRLQKGELFEVTQVRRLKMYKYKFTAMKPLPDRHQFQSGQVVELRFGDNRKGSDGQKEEMRVENCTMKLKGSVTKTNEQFLHTLEIDFSEDDHERDLFKLIRSRARDGSDVLVLNATNAMRMEIEIAADTTTFDRMEAALQNITQLKTKPLWLSAAIGSRAAGCTFKEIVDEASVADEEANRVTKTGMESSLNPSQQQAVDCSVRSRLTLIHGPPGW
jgi:hypothetical protein